MIKIIEKVVVPKSFKPRNAVIRGPITVILARFYAWEDGLHNPGNVSLKSLLEIVILKQRVLGLNLKIQWLKDQHNATRTSGLLRAFRGHQDHAKGWLNEGDTTRSKFGSQSGQFDSIAIK